MTCDCFFCGATQEVGEPPCLVVCSKCGKDFRVFRNRSGIPAELSKPVMDARKAAAAKKAKTVEGKIEL